MKSKYTLVIRDNKNSKNSLEFAVDSIRYEISPLRQVMNIRALLDEEEKTPQEYLIDEEAYVDETTEKIVDCSYGHSWVTATGFSSMLDFCEQCGIKK